ncbi:MAG: leishmanolysin-related zinc metalloendopeptidase [Pirellulales bacterium]
MRASYYVYPSGRLIFITLAQGLLRTMSQALFHAEQLERRDCPAGFTLTPIVDTVVEGSPAEFRITMDAPSPIPQQVMVSSESLTALLGTDFMHRSQRITFFPGETSKNFTIQTLRDPVETTEGIETFRVFVRPIGGTPSELFRDVTIDDYVPAGNFAITFNFTSDVPESVITASARAAERWSEIIIGDLPSVTSATYGFVDDLLINIQIGLLDDIADGDTLANARPIAFRTDSLGLPYVAEVGISADEVDNATLDDVLIHEFAHCLGFPTSNAWANLVDDPTTPTLFLGTEAVSRYNSVFGNTDIGVPIEQDFGEGTAFAHWTESIFGDEILTGFIGVLNPISVITVGAYDDMGYDVDYSAADPYTPPATTTTTTTTTAASVTSAVSVAPFSPIPLSIAATPPATPSRVLPARITFADRAPVILSSTDASRRAITSALTAVESGSTSNTHLDLRHLTPQQRAVLASWAALGSHTTPTASSLSTKVQHGPAFRISNSVFASLNATPSTNGAGNIFATNGFIRR